jgi:Trk K+ transport system NAD-binding subunit
MRFVIQLCTHLRFGGYLLWEFRWPLGVFWTVVLAGGAMLHGFYHKQPLAYPEACYQVFLLFFLQPSLPFPEEWFLQPFFFLVPMLGVAALADSLVRMGYLVFARRRNLPEWQRMVASSYRNHIVVVGAGKVGYHIIRGLVAVHEPVVAVEIKTQSLVLDEVHDLGVPVITGNARHQKILEQASVRRARVIILATDDDLANLDAGLTARDLNPKIRVVLRLFDDTLATKFASNFQMPAISVSEVSAPAFIAAATGHKVYQTFELDGHHLHVTDLTISPTGSLAGQLVGQVQGERLVNIVMHRGPGGVLVNPPHDKVLAADDTVLVIAARERLAALEVANRLAPTARECSPHAEREDSSKGP